MGSVSPRGCIQENLAVSSMFVSVRWVISRWRNSLVIKCDHRPRVCLGAASTRLEFFFVIIFSNSRHRKSMAAFPFYPSIVD